MTKLLGCILLMASGLLLVLLRAQVTLSFPEPHNLVVVSVPDKSSALQVDLLHLKLKESQLDSSAQRRRIMADDPKGWTFSAFIYPLDGNLRHQRIARQRVGRTARGGRQRALYR
jgi:hypothetical protein